MTSAERTSGRARPAPLLVVAAVLVGLEALVLLGVAASVVLGSAGSRAGLGVTTTVFFVLYGVGLLLCAWGLARVRRWARAPAVLTQLLQILVAWNFLPGEAWLVWLAVALMVAAVAVLAAVLSPPVTRALVDDPS